MRRAVGTWLVVVLLVIATGAGAVLALSAATFGASSFVRVYLEAVGRGDAAGALTLPGVTVAPNTRADFLTGEALDGLVGLREVSVDAGDDGTTLVTYAWSTALGDGVSTFTVEPNGATLGVFPEWRFAVSPVATLRLTVEHDERFSLAGVAAESGVAAAEPVSYALLVPGVYRVDHGSAYLEADALDVVAARPASTLGATLDVQPARTFLDAITTEVHASLDACAKQEVLFPTGCPLGRAIANRVVSTPEWSIVEYPTLEVEPASEFGVWLVPPAEVVSHLKVEVQSLFDGSISTHDEDLPVLVSYLVTILPDDATLSIHLAP